MEQKRMSVGGKIWWILNPAVIFVIVVFIWGIIAAIFEIDTDSGIANIVSIALTIPVAIFFMKRDTNRHNLSPDKNVKTGVLTWAAIVLCLGGYCVFFNFLTSVVGIRDIFPSFNESAAELYAGTP
jgi:membrane-bound ClpP family serine protease